MTSKEAMKLALQKGKEAQLADNGPFGAAILKKGKLIVATRNTSSEDTDPTAHAEVNAIREACKKLNTTDLSGCILYTSCHPCPMCLSASKWANIEKIVYSLTNDDTKSLGFEDWYHYEEMSRSPSERDLPFDQLMNEEGKEMLT